MADEILFGDEDLGGRYRAPLGGNGSADGAAAPTSERTADSLRHSSDGERFSASRRREHSPAALLRQLLGDAALLFRKEIALAASEVSQSIDSAKTGAISMVSGGAVLYAGFLFLLGAAAFALALVVPTWAAWLIVGAATALVGTIMVRAGKSRVSADSFAPHRAVDALRKDSAAIRRQM
jgi:hypothetical protein